MPTQIQFKTVEMVEIGPESDVPPHRRPAPLQTVKRRHRVIRHAQPPRLSLYETDAPGSPKIGGTHTQNPEIVGFQVPESTNGQHSTRSAWALSSKVEHTARRVWGGRWS